MFGCPHSQATVDPKAERWLRSRHLSASWQAPLANQPHNHNVEEWPQVAELAQRASKHDPASIQCQGLQTLEGYRNSQARFDELKQTLLNSSPSRSRRQETWLDRPTSGSLVNLTSGSLVNLFKSKNPGQPGSTLTKQPVASPRSWQSHRSHNSH